jgi:hypothetical protein
VRLMGEGTEEPSARRMGLTAGALQAMEDGRVLRVLRPSVVAQRHRPREQLQRLLGGMVQTQRS